MWRQIRGKGYAYGYTMMVKPHEGLLYLVFSRATNVVGAYMEAKEIILNQINKEEWDNNLIDSARSSLIFELIEKEKTIGSVIGLSVISYFQQVDFTYNRFIFFVLFIFMATCIIFCLVELFLISFIKLL
jgi:Zn-dependent M16 (insulinase) family peptidase